jgi:hypothetical protein
MAHKNTYLCACSLKYNLAVQDDHFHSKNLFRNANQRANIMAEAKRLYSDDTGVGKPTNHSLKPQNDAILSVKSELINNHYFFFYLTALK